MTYGTLKADIASYLYDRTDLSQAIPGFIRTAEAKIYRRVRVQENENWYIYSVEESTGDMIDLPPGYIEVIGFYTSADPLERVSVSQWAKINWPGSGDSEQRAAAGIPRVFCRNENKFRISPADADTEMSVHYYVNWPQSGLHGTGDTDSNPLLDIAYDLHLHGALLEASAYLGQDSRIGVWKGLYDEALAELSAKDSAESMSGDYIQVQSVY